jgi:hypothetical protein
VFGGDDTDVGHGILANADGSMVTCASTKSSGAGSNDFLLTKFNAAGGPLWSFTYGDTASNSCFGMARGPDGGYYLAGGTQFTSGAADPLVMRVDSGGTLRWLRTDYASGNAQVRGISGRGAAGALAAGFLAEAPERCWVLGIDSSGESVWDWSWGIGASGLDGVIELRCGSHLAFGYTTVNAHLCGYAMFLTPDQGIYGTVRDSEDDTPLAGVTVRALGETCVSQTTSVGRFALALDAGIYDLEFSGPCLSTDTLFGLEVWADSVRTVEIPARRPRLTEWPTSVNILAHNRVQAAGQLVLHNAGVGDLSFALNVRQSRPAGTWLSFIPATGIVPANSSFSVQALVQADTTDDRIYDFSAVVDLRTNSCPDSVLSIPVFVTVLEVDEPPSVPRELTMSALFPNPFNAVAEFAISLPMGGLVDIGVYDITGRRAAVLQHGDLAPGSHEIRFDGSALSTGIYFVELRMGSQRLLQKAVLLK